MASLRRYDEVGVVSLEFILLFPLIVAMLYASAVYGIVFFSKYKMQSAVDQAVNAALYMDRAAYPNDEGENTSSALEAAVVQRAQTMLKNAIDDLPLKGLEAGNACSLKSLDNDVEVVRCALTYNQVNTIVPVMRFGWLGEFPPLPKQLEVTASAAF